MLYRVKCQYRQEISTIYWRLRILLWGFLIDDCSQKNYTLKTEKAEVYVGHVMGSEMCVFLYCDEKKKEEKKEG